MESPIVSVIVPVYRTEQYLERCVRSILGQTLPGLELILIDDGSPDSCPTLCDKLAKEDNRIVVIHQKNGGVSSARNAGLSVARGKYIAFIDSDDYVSLDYLETLCETAEKNGATWVWGVNSWILPDGLHPAEFPGVVEQTKLYCAKDVAAQFMEFYLNLIIRHVWGNLYLRSEIKTAFNQSLSLGEDVTFNMNFLTEMQGPIALSAHSIYYYDQSNEGSVMCAFSGYKVGNFFIYCHAIQAFLHQYLSATQENDTYHKAFLEQLIFETQYLIYRATPQECRKRVESYLLQPEVQQVAHEADRSTMSHSYRLAVMLIRHKWISLYTLVFRIKWMLLKKKL